MAEMYQTENAKADIWHYYVFKINIIIKASIIVINIFKVYKKFLLSFSPRWRCSVYKKVHFSRDVRNMYSIYNFKKILWRPTHY